MKSFSCQNPYLTLIKSGRKKAEGRLYKEAFRELQVNDRVRFYCNVESVICRITYLHVYPSFPKMLEKELQVLLPNIESIQEGVKIYRSFPNYSAWKEKHFGVVAIGIEVEEILAS